MVSYTPKGCASDHYFCLFHSLIYDWLILSDKLNNVILTYLAIYVIFLSASSRSVYISSQSQNPELETPVHKITEKAFIMKVTIGSPWSFAHGVIAGGLWGGLTHLVGLATTTDVVLPWFVCILLLVFSILVTEGTRLALQRGMVVYGTTFICIGLAVGKLARYLKWY